MKQLKTSTAAWLKAAAIRALKTAAQTAVAMIPVAASIADVDWKAVVGTAALSAVESIRSSLAGLPEVEE